MQFELGEEEMSEETCMRIVRKTWKVKALVYLTNSDFQNRKKGKYIIKHVQYAYNKSRQTSLLCSNTLIK